MPSLIVDSGAIQLGKNTFGANVITLSAPTPASGSRIISIPDSGINCNLQLSVVPDVAVSASATLSTSQSGSLIDLVGNSSTPAYTITLPSASSQAGITYKFVVGISLYNSVTISCPTAKLYGSVVSSDGTAVTGGYVVAKSNIIKQYNSWY